jgi:O-antigen/teichoic acid export membrane protein
MGFGINFIISFLFKVLVARYLGVTGFGVFSLGATIVAISAVVLLGLDRGIGRYMPREDGRAYKRGILLSGLLVGVPVALVAGLVVSLSAETIAVHLFGSRESSEIVRIFAIAIPFAVLVRLSVGGIQGMQLSAPKVYVNNLALPISRLVLTTVVVVLGLGTIGVAWAYTAAFVLGGLLGVFFLIRRTPLLADVTPQFHHEELLRFSLPIMIVTTANMLFTSVDNLMLGYFVGPSNVGIYNSAFSLARISLVVLLSFTFVVMPIMSEFHSNGQRDEMQSLYQTVAKWIYILSFPIAFVFLLAPETVMRLIYGPGYGLGGVPLSILIVGMLSHAVAGPNENTLISIGETRGIVVDSIIVLLLNVVLNLLLIPQFSYVGAAAASSASFVLLNLLYTGRLYFTGDITPFPASFFKIVLVSLFVLIGGKYVFVVVPTTPIVITGVGTAGLFLYVVLVAFLGEYGSDERRILEACEDRTGLDLSYFKQWI